MVLKYVKIGSKRAKDLIFFICLVALPLLQFFIFYVCVNFNSILLAFKEYDTDGNYTFVFFKNFSNLFDDFKRYTLFSVALKNTLIIFVVGTVVSTVLSLLFSYYIYKQAPMKNLFKVLLFMPSIIPAIALVTIFKQFADNAIPSMIAEITQVKPSGLIQNPSTTMATILFYNIWGGFGVGVLLYVSAMSGISDSIVEAAKIDGVNFFTEFIYITFPLVFNTFRTFIIVALGSIFINQANLVSFFGTTAEESNFTIGYYLYKETVGITLANSNVGLPKLAAFGLLLTGITLPIVFTTNWLMKRFGPNTEG